MAISASALYKGDLKCAAKLGGSEVPIETDAKGTPGSFSPTDVLSAALATCTASMIGFVAAQQNIDMTGLSVEVGKEMQQSPASVKTFKVKVIFPKVALEDSMKKRLEGAAKACPVKNSLNPSIEIVTEFVY
ncbi:OsmC family protein [bacterium]|nr:OsmC family protein [bacterium]